MSFDQAFWEENGYMIIPGVVSQGNLQAVVDAIWNYTGKQPTNRESWYEAPMLEGAMVNMSNHQALWDNRQAPVFHEVFTELWGTEKLWVVLDRVNMNPPIGPHWDYEGFLHWDMDPTKPPEPLYQGVLYLTDTTEEMGGFQCVPGSHRRLREWQTAHRSEEIESPDETANQDWMMNKLHPIKEWVMSGLERKSIPAKAGDFLIWDVALLHGNGKNVSNRPRLAQYISMTPEGTARSKNLVYGGEELRQARISSWQCGPFPGLVAEAIGVPEGIASVWLNRILEDPAAAGDLPPIRFDPRLTEPQRQALPTLLANDQPWAEPEVIQAKSLHRQYGISGLFLSAERLSQKLVNLMAAEFGLTFEVQPAQLTELGQKLLGLKTW